MQRVRLNIILRVIGLFITTGISSYLVIKGLYSYLFISIPVIIYQLNMFYRSQIVLYDELQNFSDAIHYRDFSRNFNTNTTSELQIVRKSFNDISNMFKQVSLEKETQYQYLQKILELVNTGILSYDSETGEVIWMNESLKQMLDLPYLKKVQSLLKRDENLYQELTAIKPGESKVASIFTNKLNTKVLLSATAFQTDGKKYNLIAFQNINEALDETESKAWQKLLSVLTHEIMNSIAPISSLADTIKNRLETLDKKFDSDNSLVDMELGISTIKRRSEGLLKFAETYRNLNKITKPNLQKFYVRDLFENLHSLMQPTFQQKSIEVDVILKDPNMVLEADLTLIEQVMINLLVNAIEAVKAADNPQITLYAETLNDKPLIKVLDNGSGIAPDLIDKIFIPFFSTRKTGSGIGLTLCKQIMMIHGGNIQAISQPGDGTSFILQF